MDTSARPEASDGILTSAGICERFAGAGVSSGGLLFAGLVAGMLAMGTVASRIVPLRDALAVSAAFAAGALPWLAIVLIPGPVRALVTFVVVLAALALTGWVSARISEGVRGATSLPGSHHGPVQNDNYFPAPARTSWLCVTRAARRCWASRMSVSTTIRVRPLCNGRATASM